MSKFKIVLLKKGEGKLLKDIRLRALKDSPDSFGQKYEEVVDKPLSFWEEKALEVNTLDDRITILTMHNKKPVGMLYCFIRDPDKKIGALGGMWVDPDFRKNGVGKAMVNKAIVWQKEKGIKKLTFWNAEGNEVSDLFYKKMGFYYSGKKRPLESNPNRSILEMEKEL